MKKLKNKITIITNKKYKEMYFNDLEFINYLTFIKEKINFLNKNKKINKKYCIVNKKNNPTKNHLISLLKKRLSVLEKSIILKYYIKFECNLNLKHQYSLKYKKMSYKNTDIETYIYLGILIYQIENINYLQKLNILLKIMDKIILNKNLNKIKDLFSLQKFCVILIKELKKI